MRSIAGNRKKKDRLSAVYNGLVKVFLITRQFITIPSHIDKIVDTSDMLFMPVRSRVQREWVLKRCDDVVNIGK